MTTEDTFYKMQLQRFELFKAQDPETGDFDVTFEIGGKKLFANKYILTSISDTFKTMLSERWTTKDTPIVLDGYTFDAFYEFLCFLYSANCALTDTNIFTMLDIAEYYHVEVFKDACDQYLCSMKYSLESVADFMVLSNKYGLDKLKARLVKFVDENFFEMLESNAFMNGKKLVIDFVLECHRGRYREEKLFEAVYAWAEKQVSIKQKVSIFELDGLKEAIKEELDEILPKINFVQMSHKFLLQFVVTNCGHLFSYEELGEILTENYNNELKTHVKLLDTDLLHIDSDDDEEEKDGITGGKNLADMALLDSSDDSDTDLLHIDSSDDDEEGNGMLNEVFRILSNRLLEEDSD